MMRHALAVALLACAGLSVPLSAAAAEDPTAVRAMVNAGAVELALARVEALQPRDPAVARWADWEGVRCDALARLNRHAALLARVSALPQDTSASALGSCFVGAAQASLALNNVAAARAHAARVLWQRSSTPAEVKAVRLTVIESYIAERRGDDAFRSMLRFQQDYQPLERGVTDRFVEALLDLGLDRDALNWVGRTDQISPALLRLQLRGGALSADAVIAQARAANARGPDPAYWRAIHEAAVKNGAGAIQIEALERMLQNADARNATNVSDLAQRLWQAYFTTANEIGNREQLLTGDDGAWSDYAARRLGSSPFLARAFYGYLAQRGQSADMRRNAQLQLAFSLSSSGLDLAALRTMQSIGFEAGDLDEQTRYLLGTLAAKRNDASQALKLWSGLPTPPNVNAGDWQVTLARTALQAGDPAASVETMKRLLAGARSLPPDLAAVCLEIAQDMLDMRALDAAQAMYELVAPLANDARAREALFGLGRVQELKGASADAAASYLRSALLVQAAAPDPLAYQARLLAGLNLMRAGLRDDARAQFEWLIRNSKEPALTEAAKRGLERVSP